MSFIRCLRAALRGPSLLVPVLALAQAAPTTQVFVTAARMAQPLDQVLADVRTIDRAAIERAGSASLAQLLQRLGGVEVSASGGPGQVSGLYLRGSNANHVVLLIDGVRINSATAGTNAFENLPLEQIERIEVLLGPASGLYGADAIGGVIQIFTRNRDGLDARVEFGSDRTRAASFAFGRRYAETTLTLQAGARASRTGSATNVDHPFSFNADDDPYRNANAGATLTHQWAAGQSLTLRGQHSEGVARFDAGPGSDDLNRQRLSNWALESQNRLGADWTSLVRIARGSDHMQTDGSYPSRFRTDQDQLSWQNDLAFGDTRLSGGAEWRRERIDSDTAFSATARSVASLFGNAAATRGDLGWQFALRHDRNSQFGDHTTGHAALGWQVAPAWRLSASAGTAFKAPSFNDLYYPLQFGYSGNPALRPERSQSAELAARYQRDGWQARWTLFDNRIRDLISINSSFSTVDNVARARIRGMTLSAARRQGPWHARAEWTHQSPRDADTGAPLPRRADDFGSLGFDWAQGRWRLGADLVASGARIDAGGAPLAGYGLVNLQAAHALNTQWTLQARIHNAADKAYTLVQGYNTSGRGVFVSLSFSER